MGAGEAAGTALGLRTGRYGLGTAVALAAGLLSVQLAHPGATHAPGAAHGLEPAASTNQVDTRSAAAVRTAYRERWKPSTTTKVSSGGTASSCSSAGTNGTQQDATRQALNFARGLVGENAVRFTSTYNTAAARSALITAANQALSHDPPRSWTCWSQAGHDASARSNILLTGSAPDAASLVNLYLSDPGSSNTDAGHRRWLLRPEATAMGSGNAQGRSFGNAIYVLTSASDDDRGAAAKAFYAWPSAGYFPSQLEPGGRWSLSSSTGASFARAKVSVTNPQGNTVAITRRTTHAGYGDNTLVWDFARYPADVTTAAPRTFTVRVTGISGGPASSYTYYVRLFDPTKTAPTDEPASLPIEK